MMSVSKLILVLTAFIAFGCGGDSALSLLVDSEIRVTNQNEIYMHDLDNNLIESKDEFGAEIPSAHEAFIAALKDYIGADAVVDSIKLRNLVDIQMYLEVRSTESRIVSSIYDFQWVYNLPPEIHLGVSDLGRLERASSSNELILTVAPGTELPDGTGFEIQEADLMLRDAQYVIRKALKNYQQVQIYYRESESSAATKLIRMEPEEVVAECQLVEDTVAGVKNVNVECKTKSYYRIGGNEFEYR